MVSSFRMRMNYCNRTKLKTLVVIVICLICLRVITSGYSRQGEKPGRHVVKFPNTHFIQKDVKNILMWTTFFSHDNGIQFVDACMSKCPYKCSVTEDKSQIEAADAVEFHLSDMWRVSWSIGTKKIVELPTYRRPDQIWVVSNMEPPPHLFGNIEIFNGLFNWTKWYRDDSDVVMNYGKAHELNADEQQKMAANYSGRNFFKEKSRGVSLRISNCFDPGRRYKVISELERFMSIDKYGACYRKQCGNSNDPADHTCDEILKSYKFYLAFENDNCKDYVTEKYWLTLIRDQIPIVNWKFMTPTKVIPHSFINIYDFDTLADAAVYINKVSTNETLYNSYFAYKTKYVNREDTCATCKLCEALHDRKRPGQVYMDLDGWVRNDYCKKVELWNNFMKNVYGWRFYLLGF